MMGQIASREDAAIHLGMQGLDAAVHHFRKAGVVADLGHGDAVFLQQLGGAAGRQDLHPARIEGPRKSRLAGCIGNADQGATDANGGRGGEGSHGRRGTENGNLECCGGCATGAECWSRSECTAWSSRLAAAAYSMPCCVSFLRSVLRFRPSRSAARVWLPSA